MSLRSRRAMMPRSTSASTTTRPDTMCSPPANRSSDATSARRALTELTTRRLSSSLTSAVIATGRHLSVRSLSVWAHVGATGAGGAVPRNRTPSSAAANLAGSCKGVPGLDTSANSTWASRIVGGAAQLLTLAFARHPAGVDDDVVHGEPRRVLGQHVDMPFGREPRRLPRFGHQVQHQRPPRRRRLQRRRQLRAPARAE